MIIHEWKFIMESVGAYGFVPPMFDVGGVLDTAIRQYDPLLLYGPKPEQHIWSGIATNCDTTHNVQNFNGGPYGTIVSSSTLEHVRELFSFFPSVNRLLRDGGLCFLSAPMRWMVHGSMPMSDFWRFTPDGMRVLAESAGLVVCETGLIEVDPHRAMSWIICGKSMRSRGPTPVVDVNQWLEVVPE